MSIRIDAESLAAEAGNRRDALLADPDLADAARMAKTRWGGSSIEVIGRLETIVSMHIGHDRLVKIYEAAGLQLKKYGVELNLRKIALLTAELDKIKGTANAAATFRAEAAAARPGIPPQRDEETQRTAAAALSVLRDREAATATVAWNVESLSALCDSVFGKGTAVAALQEPILIECGANNLGEQMNACSNSYERERMAKEFDAATRAREAEANKPAAKAAREAEQLGKLKACLLEAGVRVPGLSYKGLTVSHSSASQYASRPEAKAFHQAAVDEFCAVLTGDEAAGLSNSKAAAAAKSFIESKTNARFVLGATLPKTNL